MFSLKKFCEYIYNSLYIPIYLYENNEVSTCYPVQGKDTLPPLTYLKKLWEDDKMVSYTLTQFHSYYGCIKIENSSYNIIIGPINDFPYTNESLLSISREFCIESSNKGAFFEFFHRIPTQNLGSFINTLILISYTLNNTELTRKDIEGSLDNRYDAAINQRYSEEAYAAKEEGIFNNSYEIETRLMRYIETGNVEGLQRFAAEVRDIKVGTIADTDLRQFKNLFIVTVTLAARAAIKGGLTPSVAFQLSDIYIQQMERLKDIELIKSLLNQVQLDFAKRVAKSIVPAASDGILHSVIQFVLENTNKNITVAEVADHVGFNRSSLSRKVSKELGIELSAFIRKCKLEEAKDLLAFSDKSISEISNYLCFSSQSHFQKAFKDQYGVTPYTFRKSVK